MKELAKNFLIMLAVCAYVAGFAFLMIHALIAPINRDSIHPTFSVWAILAWVIYICAGGAVYVKLRTQG